jgi:hypothetical protein
VSYRQKGFHRKNIIKSQCPADQNKFIKKTVLELIAHIAYSDFPSLTRHVWIHDLNFSWLSLAVRDLNGPAKRPAKV